MIKNDTRKSRLAVELDDIVGALVINDTVSGGRLLYTHKVEEAEDLDTEYLSEVIPEGQLALVIRVLRDRTLANGEHMSIPWALSYNHGALEILTGGRRGWIVVTKKSIPAVVSYLDNDEIVE